MVAFAVDTSVLIAIFKGEVEAEVFTDVLSNGEWSIGWPNVLEANIWSIRNRPSRSPILLSQMLSDSSVSVVPFDGTLEGLAAEAYANFGKGRHAAKLNYGDCMTYAVAMHYDVPLLFKGADFGQTDVKVHQASVITK
jgi:ribonuclease VapC